MGQANFTNILPDPNNLYNDVGQAAGSVGGPGYRSVKLSSKHQTQRNRTNSGRTVTRQVGAHQWEIDIEYNPMTREEFEPIYSFLLRQQGGLNSFFVSLPQYRFPRDTNLKTNSDVNNFSPTATTNQGVTNMLITVANYDSSNTTHGKPRPGDIFTFDDATVHTKTYQITNVETAADYQDAIPNNDTDKLRIYFTPPLQRQVFTSTDLIFSNPLFRVQMKNDIQEYSLGANGLYSFSLKLIEAQR